MAAMSWWDRLRAMLPIGSSTAPNRPLTSFFGQGWQSKRMRIFRRQQLGWRRRTKGLQSWVGRW